MLKLRKDGSDTDSSTRICWVYLWPYLANTIYPFCDFLLPMKHSIRPFFSILLLLVFAATLCLKTLVCRSNPLSKGFDNNALFQTPPKRVFNSTLLKYASIDLGEAKLKQEIENLLEGNFDSLGRYRTFASWRRVNGRDIRSKTSNGLPLSLRSPSFYRSWLNFRRVLHNWERNKRFQQEIMSQLINLVKHPIDKHNGLVGSSSNQRYKSCAVVGNSGILLKTGYGKVIDSNEIVIRLNNARIEKYESKVGSKTNISFVNSNILHLCGRREGCFCHPYGENLPMVMYICQPLHLFDYIVCNGSQKAPLIITDARFDVLCGRIVKYYSLKRFVEQTGKSFEEWGPTHDGSMFHYSSGMQAIMLALGICDKVSVFGFGKSDSAKHHYHTNQKAELHLHDYEAEYDFYKDLVERPRLIPFIPESFKIPPLVVYK